MTILVYRTYLDSDPILLDIGEGLEKGEINIVINKVVKDWLCYEIVSGKKIRLPRKTKKKILRKMGRVNNKKISNKYGGV